MEMGTNGWKEPFLISSFLGTMVKAIVLCGCFPMPEVVVFTLRWTVPRQLETKSDFRGTCFTGLSVYQRAHSKNIKDRVITNLSLIDILAVVATVTIKLPVANGVPKMRRGQTH